MIAETTKEKIMRKLALPMVAIGLAVAPLLSAAPARAVSLNHTWVASAASGGSDANNCDRPTPCATFTVAYSKTAVGGEIACVDAGNFGGVSITHSITITCETVGSSTAPGGAGSGSISINTATTDVVILSGLDLDGLNIDCMCPGAINFTGAGALHLSNSKIKNWPNATSAIAFNPTGAAKLIVDMVSLINNGSSGVNGGIVIKPGSGVHADVSILGVLVDANFFGIIAIGSSGGIIRGVVRSSVITGNVNFGIGISTGSESVVLLVDGDAITNNSYGLVAVGAGAGFAVGKSNIMFNTTGVY